MLIVFIVLWLIAAALLLLDAKSTVMRWLSVFVFTGGCGALGAVLDNDLIPYLTGLNPAHVMLPVLIPIKIICSLTCYYGLPYSYMMLALHYNASLFSVRMRKYLSCLLLLPIAACLLFTPAYTALYPITYSIVVWWVIPYLVAGSIIIALRKELRPVQRERHLITCMVLFPPVLAVAAFSYTFPAIGFLQMWRYNTWVLLFVVPYFIYTIIRHGFMGIQLFVEARKLDSTLRAITSGTALMNHSIKNDVGKMRLFGDKIKRQALEAGHTELLADLQVMLSSTEHIHELINNVHKHTKDESPVLSEVVLAPLLQVVLDAISPYLQAYTVQVSVPVDAVLRADASQIKEMLTNLIINATEAMPDGGFLTIVLNYIKKGGILEIRDTGVGISPSNLRKVLEPFYTTKSSSGHNFGLGLSYSYNVMKHHGGSLQISSELAKGTSIYLIFPRIRHRPYSQKA